VHLSKSLYLRGLQCPKSLWLKQHHPERLSPPDVQAQAVFATGDRVGVLARELFAGGVTIPWEGTSFEEKIALTRRHIEAGVETIYEASFAHAGVFVMVDVLRIHADGSVSLYEVKSSTEVKEVYLHDVAIQYFVLTGAGYRVRSAQVVHIDNTYIRGEELDIEQLFAMVDVTDTVIKMQEDIPTHLSRFEQVVSDAQKEPEIDIGTHCTTPYPCDAMGYCWAHVPSQSVFDIARLRADKKFALYYEGVVTFDQIDDLSRFSSSQQLQIVSQLRDETHIDAEAIRSFVSGLTYPICHLDFETFQQAIPEWKGLRPFEQIPFQYSLHIETETGVPEHREFLAEQGADPRRDLAEHLVRDMPTEGTVLAYNMGFEKGVIRRLAEMFDDLSASLMAIHDRIRDLMVPFQKKAYYTPAMQGSYSIKRVLPALVPEMAQAYHDLDGVHNGGDAMQAYAHLGTLDDPEEIARTREALLRYCELDTLAMVAILRKLREVAS
jgi:hypothetical protein